MYLCKILIIFLFIHGILVFKEFNSDQVSKVMYGYILPLEVVSTNRLKKTCSLGITVFHDAAIPPDDFVANCTIPFDDLMHRDKDASDFWVSSTHMTHYAQNIK